MGFKSAHRLLLSLVTALFLGQSLAAASVSCAAMAGSADAVQDLHGEHHDHGAHPMADAAQSTASACCDGGFCSQLDCAAVLAVPADSPTGLALAPGRFRPVPGQPLPRTHLSIPYRPPITP